MTAWLDEPRLGGIPVGSTEWFTIQRSLILERPLIRQAYLDWYRRMLADADSVALPGSVLEVGSGPNFVKTLNADVITSDIVAGISDLVIDAQTLPFADESLRALLLTHVFHHIPDVVRFLEEATRTLVPGGVIAMVDVAHTPFARFFFRRFHPEDYDDIPTTWQLNPAAPLGGANQALTWMVFCRDTDRFRAVFPELRIEVIELLPWLSYLCSGGLTKRYLIPAPAAPLFGFLDRSMRFLDPAMALHWHIRIRKVVTRV